MVRMWPLAKHMQNHSLTKLVGTVQQSVSTEQKVQLFKLLGHTGLYYFGKFNSFFISYRELLSPMKVQKSTMRR